MKTNSLKAIENVNTVANIKTMATMCTKDLKKRLAKEERDLKSLINKRMNDTIINAQREIIAQLQQEIAQVESKKLASTVALKDDVITFRLAKDGKEDTPYVYKVENDKLVKTTVETGDEGDSTVEITSGLKEGDQIIFSNSEDIKDGMTLEEFKKTQMEKQQKAKDSESDNGGDKNNDKGQQSEKMLQPGGAGGPGFGGGGPRG